MVLDSEKIIRFVVYKFYTGTASESKIYGFYECLWRLLIRNFKCKMSVHERMCQVTVEQRGLCHLGWSITR